MDTLQLIPSLAALPEGLEYLETVERQLWVCKQPRLSQEVELAAALPQLVAGKGGPQADVAMMWHGDEKALGGVDKMVAADKKGPMGTWEKRLRGTSRECSFWKAWFHIARWREQEIDALKEAKARVFHRSQTRRAMAVLLLHWRISTPVVFQPVLLFEGILPRQGRQRAQRN